LQVRIPKEILDLAARSGVSREKISRIMGSFAILEVVASASKLSRKDAENLSHQIKVAAWKRLSLFKR
jgi:hypothetical protein